MAGPVSTTNVARARLLYLRTVVPLGTIATLLGLSTTTFRRRLAALNWRPRVGAGSRPGAPTPREPQLPRPVISRAAGPIDRLETGRAVERFIAGRIAAYEAEASAGTDPEPERTARTVSHYARALGLVRAYLVEIEKERDAAETGPPPRSLSELRDELRRHLDRLHDEGGAVAGLSGA